MQILITGGTGFIGKELVKVLRQHQLTILTRDTNKAASELKHADFGNIQYIKSLTELNGLNSIDAIINLAGEPIADRRWTNKQKQRLCDSRWTLTQQLVDLIQASTSPPSVFISGSAVGFYGNQHEHCVDENALANKSSFTHAVCDKWERIATDALSEHTRVCIVRTGVVLGKEGGALKKMLLPYKLGLGGPIGDGKQYLPWIHIQDMVNALHYLLENEQAQGDFNFSAPHPVPYALFSRTLARTLQRPHFLFTPAWLIQIAMGESSAILLDSVRAKPKHLTELGYNFTFPRLDRALKNLLT